MTGRSQDASVFSTCHGKFLLTATVGLVIFCFTATTTAVCSICVTLPLMQFARLLRCIHLLGCRRFLLCIGVTTLVILVYLRKTGTISNLQAVISRVPTPDTRHQKNLRLQSYLASVAIRGQNCRDQPRQYRATETKTLYFNLEKISSQT